MEIEQTLSQHYTQLLGLTYPWGVEKVTVDIKNLKIFIYAAYEKGNKPPCPVCEKSCIIADHRQTRTWRHLDTMQFETNVVSCVPRVTCPEHGVKTIPVPWADVHSRYPLLFEKFSIDVLLASENLTQAQKLLRLSWDQIALSR